MNIGESIRVALRGLSANKLRGILTMLGVIIGVAAVIALMSIGNGTQAQITSSVQSLGTNLVFITPGQQRQQGNVRTGAGNAQTLTSEDATAIDQQLGGSLLTGVSPERTTGAQLIAGGQNWATRVIGATPAYQDVHSFHVAEGDFISDQQATARSSVIVLGATVAQNLFGDSDPIGQNVRVSAGGRTGTSARVIGVMETKGGSGIQNQDDQAFMPLSTVQTKLNPQRSLNAGTLVGTITVQAASENDVDAAIQAIGDILRQRHHTSGTDDDFVISSQRDFLSAISQITGVFTAFLGAIAGISLVVGGIGIMNIMLVSVTERTREIGIRKAVGAKRRDILVQFLIEAIVVSVTGGALGIVIGAGISHLASNLNLNGQSIPSIIAPSSVLLAFSVSAAVGLFFGIYPAMRASRLNPIDALRYE
ncbi:MAG: putative transport system permease protein [Chloroflexota bacterium]|jgi:putative ABC transport system permease protein|nr:putative transport system permease protein [Chloroflexota bacterium]